MSQHATLAAAIKLGLHGVLRVRHHAEDVARLVADAGDVVEGANPNGALDDIAGVCNEARNVFGMMPHPENSVEAELDGGGEGGVLTHDVTSAVRSTVSMIDWNSLRPSAPPSSSASPR